MYVPVLVFVGPLIASSPYCIIPYCVVPKSSSLVASSRIKFDV